MLPERPSNRNRRILISRENASHRHITNFAEIESLLAAYGFETIAPDKLSFEQEIELFYDAQIVVGAHGSGLANVVFSDKASVVNIFPTKFMIPHIYRISKSLGHDYYPVMGTGSDRFPSFLRRMSFQSHLLSMT